MEITQIRVFPVEEEKLKAFVSIVLDDCFVVSDIKIIEGASGLFVSMPSKKRRNGTFRDIAHPLNNETRRWFEERIIGEYRQVVQAAGQASAAPLRQLDEDGADGGSGEGLAGRDTVSRRDVPEPPLDRPGG